MAEKFRFFDPVMDENGNYDREYNAQEFVEYFSALVTTGVMKGAGNQLTVTADNASMVTTIDTGIAFILGRFYENDAPLQHTHDTETVGKQRIDRIVIRMDNNAGSRYVKSFVKKGIASTTPIPPALTRDGEIYEISVAQVKVIGGQTFISAENVIDERGTDDICPWAGSRILPNFDNAALEEHIHDSIKHTPYGVSNGDVNMYNVNIDPMIDAYVEGMALVVKIHTTSTSMSMISINNLSHKLIRKPDGTPANKGDLIAGSIYTLRYNGMDFILQGEVISKEQEPWINVVLQNGWQMVSGYKPLQYFKDKFGIVHLSGVIKAPSSGSLITTLPVGYRPSKNLYLVISLWPSALPQQTVTLKTNGEIVVEGSLTGASERFSFNSTFRLS